MRASLLVNTRSFEFCRTEKLCVFPCFVLVGASIRCEANLDGGNLDSVQSGC